LPRTFPFDTREHRLIAGIKSWTGETLIGDDCAALPSGQLITCDLLVEGTHFTSPGISFADLGYKSLAVNLSDVAAMAGRPCCAVVGLSLPEQVSDQQVEEYFAGLLECARAHHCRIVGGDLTAGPCIAVSITVLADAHEDGVMMRSGACPGDVVVLTGDLGASAAGLWLIKNQVEGYTHCRQKHSRPLPRFEPAWSLIRQTGGQGAMMDASDGLADALVQVASQSKCGIAVQQELIPVHPQTRQVAALAGVDWTNWALYGGEDYELVACLRPAHWEALRCSAPRAFVPIGSVTDRPGELWLSKPDSTQERITPEQAFQHWQQD
jgi:thiamine-monophosphate kinase